ncbi:MAG TPA: MFS transporter [Vicinamibacterales bacterium]|nr:MFS transporter [Vicinamibacterales bacterium]
MSGPQAAEAAPGMPGERRALVVIFLTVFVNLVGFGIIIPLLPFYAETFGASPLAIGLLFAAFSVCQLIASPLLGELSDRWGRRPVLLFSLLGTVVSFVMLALAHSMTMLFVARAIDGLSGGNITTARAYIGDVTTEENRAKSFGMLGAAFGLGFIVGPGLGGLFAKISYTAPIWAAAVITLVAIVLAWVWLPETVHRVHAVAGSPWKNLLDLGRRPAIRLLFAVDFLYWASFAVYQTTFALFGARRFAFDATQTGYLLSAFGFLGVVIQGVFVGTIARRLGERRMLTIGLLFAAVGWGGSALTYSLWVFVAMLVPGAIGIGLCNPSLITMVSTAGGRHEQGRVQGAAGALESLGRTIGPIWGNGLLQVWGEGTAYASAALVLVATAALSTRYRRPVVDQQPAAGSVRP